MVYEQNIKKLNQTIEETKKKLQKDISDL